MAEKGYRVAVVGGAGTWGRYYLKEYAEHPDCEIVALVDRSADRRDAFARQYGVERVFDSVDQLLAVEVPDIVSAIVPVSQNFPTVAACARAGVRVVSCEKPISAELAEADEIVRICREQGTLFGCGQGAWATPYMPQVMAWIHAGNIGDVTGAAIGVGLPREASGGGCVQLASLRLATRMEVDWVEGWTLLSEPGYVAPPGRPEIEADSPAYGRLGLSTGATDRSNPVGAEIVCEIVNPEKEGTCFLAVTGANGQVYFSSPTPVLLQGAGARVSPVFADFLQTPWHSFFLPTIERLMRAFDSGEEPLSSGHDFRQSLEIAIALKQSAAADHQRIELPLADRSARLYPHPYRLTGGDVAGWESIGYKGPPEQLEN